MAKFIVIATITLLICVTVVGIMDNRGYWGYRYSIYQDYRSGDFVTEVYRNDGRVITIKFDKPEDVTPQLVSQRKTEAQAIIDKARVIK